MLEKFDKGEGKKVRKLILSSQLGLLSTLYGDNTLMSQSCLPGDPLEPLNNDKTYDDIDSFKYKQNKSIQSLANEIRMNSWLFNDTPSIINRLNKIIRKKTIFITQDDIAFIENLKDRYLRFRELSE